jgi:AsmA protein
MRPVKLVGFAVAGVIGLGAIAVVLILLLVDPNRHRGAIEARVRQATGRPFAVVGEIRLELFPWLALSVGKVSLGNPEGFGDAPLLTVERARVGARLVPLLRGRLDVSRIALDGLSVNLIRHADGRTNWEGFSRPSPQPGGAGGPALAGASVAGVDLTRATLTLRDEGTKSLTRLRNVEFHSGALGPARASDLELRARIDAGDGSPARRIELRTEAMLDTERSLATFTKFALSGERPSSTGGGQATPVSVTTPQIAFDWKAGTLAPATVELRIGRLLIAADVSGEQLLGARLVRGQLRLAEQSPRSIAPSLGWTLPPGRNADALTRLAGSAQVRLNGRTLTVDEIELRLDRSQLRGRVEIADLAAPAIEFKVHIDTIDLDAYRAPATKSAAVEKAPAAAPLPVAALREFTLHGTLALDHLVLAGLPLSEVNVTVSALAGDLRIVPRANAFGGTIAAAVHLDAASEPAQLGVTADIRGIDLGAAIRAFAGSDRLSGRANATANLSASGATDSALMATLKGPIDFDVQNGALEGLDVGYEIGRAQALLQGQAPPVRSGPARTPFKVLSGRSRLDHGILASDPLRLETPQLKMSGKGTFRLADQAVGYLLVAALQDVPPPLASLRGLEIPVAVTGTVHDYHVQPDLSGVLQGRVKQEIEKRKGELGEKLKDALKDLIPH